MVNILLGTILFLGKYINGYLLIYLFCMVICVSYKTAPPVVKMFKSVLQDIGKFFVDVNKTIKHATGTNQIKKK